MHGTVRVALLLFLLAGTGCTTTGATPATTPTSIAPVTTAVPGTVVATTTSTTAAATTTTTVDRLTEIAAIFEDLERRRLQAIFDQDEEAFRALYANDAYLQESLLLLDVVVFESEPSRAEIMTSEVLVDSEGCLTATVITDLTGVVEGGGLGDKQQSLEFVDGSWGISYVGKDWACNGQHPLS